MCHKREAAVVKLGPNEGYAHPGWLGVRLNGWPAARQPGRTVVLRLNWHWLTLPTPSTQA